MRSIKEVADKQWLLWKICKCIKEDSSQNAACVGVGITPGVGTSDFYSSGMMKTIKAVCGENVFLIDTGDVDGVFPAKANTRNGIERVDLTHV